MNVADQTPDYAQLRAAKEDVTTMREQIAPGEAPTGEAETLHVALRPLDLDDSELEALVALAKTPDAPEGALNWVPRPAMLRARKAVTS